MPSLDRIASLKERFEAVNVRTNNLAEVMHQAEKAYTEARTAWFESWKEKDMLDRQLFALEGKVKKLRTATGPRTTTLRKNGIAALEAALSKLDPIAKQALAAMIQKMQANPA